MPTKYYKITGLDEGQPIEPYGCTQDELDDALAEHGDMCRRYEEITKAEFDKLEMQADLEITSDEVCAVLTKEFKAIVVYRSLDFIVNDTKQLICSFDDHIHAINFSKVVRAKTAILVSKFFMQPQVVPPMPFKDVIELLVDIRFVFEVFNPQVSESVWLQHIPQENLGKDMMYVYVQVNNNEYLVNEYDGDGLLELYLELQNF